MPANEQQPVLIQVVPQLKPGRCGVSDQAVLLAAELRSAFGIDSAFVILNSDERCDLPYEMIHCSAQELVKNCLELKRGTPGALLLHVSGYGYSPDGAPTMLAGALEKVKATGQFRLAAYFHETYASGPPWKSAFWHKRRQQSALRRIIAQCGLLVTNISMHAEWLENESRRLGGAPVERLPVFSPAGDTEAPVPFTQRAAAMLVFGRASTRQIAYQKLAAAGDLVSELGIREILDVGPETDLPPALGGVPVRRMGLLPADDLPAVFSQTQFGFVTHPWFCLGKSSVFAGYCAQATIPVIAGPFPDSADGLREGLQVVTSRTAQALRRSGWEACSVAAWNWYMGHRLRVHAERYAKWMGEPA